MKNDKIGFKIMYGTNPPSITLQFNRNGMIDGEKFVFYDYKEARQFVYEMTDAFKLVWKNADVQGVKL